MTSGIFVATFSAGYTTIGEGIVVVKDGFVNGGDATYFYRGTFIDYGDDLKATVEVKHYRGPLNSVLGPLKQYTLSLSGKRSGDDFELTGGIENMPGAKITIRGTKIADLSG